MSRVGSRGFGSDGQTKPERRPGKPKLSQDRDRSRLAKRGTSIAIQSSPGQMQLPMNVISIVKGYLKEVYSVLSGEMDVSSVSVRSK